MIRYSSYGAKNFRPPSVQTYLKPLEEQYRELLELRERVRKAEAAAQIKRRFKARSGISSPSSRAASAVALAGRERALGASQSLPA
jgi:hypothetical protein